jgi:hypothetical protein
MSRFATSEPSIPSAPSPSHRDGRNVDSRTSEMMNSFEVPSSWHVVFHKFGVFNPLCPGSLSSELPNSRTQKCQNLQLAPYLGPIHVTLSRDVALFL